MDVSRETEQALRLYQDLLIKWQEKINLVSPSTVTDSWSRHFEDSLQLLPLLPSCPNTLYDLGCGAGFPGLVLALANPDLSITLIESDSKKCAFLQTVSRETGAKVSIQNKRIEAASKDLPPPSIVTARALAPLADLLSLSTPWLQSNPAMTFFFPKGQNYQTEIDEAQSKGWVFQCDLTPSRTYPEARILKLSHVILPV